MTAKEMLEEAISQANKDLSRLEERYGNFSADEKECSPEADDVLDKIDCLRDAIDLMEHAYEIMEDDYE